MGLTGFDSESKGCVSMQCNVVSTIIRPTENLTGENKYALAA